LLIYNTRNKAVHDVRINTTRATYSCNGRRNNWSDYIHCSSRQGNLFCFFIKPKLSISLGNIDENTEIRWGPLTETRNTFNQNGDLILPFRFYPLRRFVNVVVENKGRAVATNCHVFRGSENLLSSRGIGGEGTKTF
jgi:hypothetical protein